MRAVAPDAEGSVERGGIRVHYARYGSGTPTDLLLPTWSLVHSRHWKLQVASLARHFTVLTFDGRGSGRSDRPAAPAAYGATEFAADALAVLDVTKTERTVLVSVSRGALWALRLCAEPALDQAVRRRGGLGAGHRPGDAGRVERRPRWLQPLHGRCRGGQVRCPVLVMHGSDDAVRSHAQGVALADRTGGALVTLEGAGHFPHNRDPVRVNLIRQFIEGIGR